MQPLEQRVVPKRPDAFARRKRVFAGVRGRGGDGARGVGAAVALVRRAVAVAAAEEGAGQALVAGPQKLRALEIKNEAARFFQNTAPHNASPGPVGQAPAEPAEAEAEAEPPGAA